MAQPQITMAASRAEEMNCGQGATNVNERLLLDKKEIRKAIVEIFAKDEIQDTLEKQCVSDELLKVWDQRETKEMKASSCAPSQLPAEVRGVVVWYMAHLVEHLGLPEKAWFDVVTLFDVYCSRSNSVDRPGEVQVSDMPTLTAALVGLIKKFDKANRIAHQDNAIVQAVVKQLHTWLRQQGHQISNFEWDEVRVQEAAVLKVMNWQINLPTVDPWMSAFCARISAVTPQYLLPTLTWIWQQSLYLARNVLLRQATTKDFSPRHVAQGLLTLGFVTGRLLPVEAVGLTELSVPDWEWLFLPLSNDKVAASDEVNGKNQTRPSMVDDAREKSATKAAPTRHQLFLIELLQVATGTDIEILQKDCRRVFKSISDVKPQQKAQVPQVPERKAQVHHTLL